MFPVGPAPFLLLSLLPSFLALKSPLSHVSLLPPSHMVSRTDQFRRGLDIVYLSTKHLRWPRLHVSLDLPTSRIKTLATQLPIPSYQTLRS